MIEIATRVFQWRFGNLLLDIVLKLRIDHFTQFGEALLDIASVN